MAGESNESAPSGEVATEAAPAAEGSESAVELRNALVAKLKENRAAREEGREPVDPKKKPEKPAKPKADAKKPAATDADPNVASADDSPEVAAYKAERRAFAKQKRKKEAEFSSREAQIRDFEGRVQSELEVAKKDPVEWLKARGVNIRKLLVDLSTEDAEDPRDKKLRELEAKQNKAEEETKREKADREAREGKAAQATAVRQVETEMAKHWEKAEVDDFPTVATALEPEHVAQRGAEIMIEHFRAHIDAGGKPASYKELAPSAVFAIMEDELAPLKGKLANPKKGGKPPEPVRAASGKFRKAATPEAPTKRERPSQDVTRRTVREPTVGRPLNFDRESLRERLIDQARGAVR